MKGSQKFHYKSIFLQVTRLGQIFWKDLKNFIKKIFSYNHETGIEFLRKSKKIVRSGFWSTKMSQKIRISTLGRNIWANLNFLTKLHSEQNISLQVDIKDETCWSKWRHRSTSAFSKLTIFFERRKYKYTCEKQSNIVWKIIISSSNKTKV